MAEYLCKEDMSTGEYISRDEALKTFHQFCDNCTSSYNGVMCRACADAGAMDILIDIPAADVQPTKWISVKDRLPDDCVEVLVHDADCGILIGWYEKKDSIFVAEFMNELDAVTHWMPLPKLPQDEISLL